MSESTPIPSNTPHGKLHWMQTLAPRSSVRIPEEPKFAAPSTGGEIQFEPGSDIFEFLKGVRKTLGSAYRFGQWAVRSGETSHWNCEIIGRRATGYLTITATGRTILPNPNECRTGVLVEVVDAVDAFYFIVAINAFIHPHLPLKKANAAKVKFGPNDYVQTVDFPNDGL